MIKIQDVIFRYPKSDKEVLSRLNLEIADGEFLCIIGHSGCGKSTLLKLIAGLDMPTSGSVLTDNKTISGPSAERSVVFQQYSLFPWMTVLQNVTFAVNKTGRFSKSEAKERAVYFLKRTGLEHVLDAWPYQLWAVCASGRRLPELWRWIHLICCWMNRSARWIRKSGGSFRFFCRIFGKKAGKLLFS